MSTRAAVWQMVHTERRRLAADLADLTEEQWATPSLCRAWTVHDVVAHQVDTARVGKWQFVKDMVAARGDFDLANQRGVERTRRADPRDTLALLVEAADLTRMPPARLATRLVESIVHGEDIRRPLGLVGEYPEWAVHEALAHQLKTAVDFGGGREHAAGLRLVDADSGTAWGEGEEVRGTALNLLLAVSGRAVAAERFEGAGAGQLVTH